MANARAPLVYTHTQHEFSVFVSPKLGFKCRFCSAYQKGGDYEFGDELTASQREHRGMSPLVHPLKRVSLTNDIEPVARSVEKIATRQRALLEGLHR